METKPAKTERSAVVPVIVTIKVESDLLATIDAYAEAHPLHPTRTALFKAAMREYLANHKQG